MVGGNVRPSLFIVTAAAALAPVTTAIFTTSGSPCSKYCGNSLGATAADETVCTQDEYDMTNTGVVYKACMQCQMTSEYYDEGNNTDVKSFLCELLLQQWRRSSQQLTYFFLSDNLRYNLAYCLWDQPDNPHPAAGNNPCITR